MTGSCGKTSATYFLGKILGDHATCFVGVNQNCRNSILNNLFKTRAHYRFFLHEAGVNVAGDMKKITALLRPKIGIVTTIGHDHHTSFRTLEATAAEKGEMIESLPGHGTAVLNADDSHVLSMQQRTRAAVLTYGVSEEADVRATGVTSTWPERLALTVTFRGESIRVVTGLFGDTLVPSLLAAIAGALAAGVTLKQCERSLAGVEAFIRRQSIHPVPPGSWVVNDTFKASYWGFDVAIAPLKEAISPRKTVVFGAFSDMGSGKESKKYRLLARRALDFADRVIFVGSKAVYINKMMTPQHAGRLFAFENIQSAGRLLADDSIEDELIYLKSNSRLHLERVIVGQQEGFACWREVCDKITDCSACKMSGLKPVSV